MKNKSSWIILSYVINQNTPAYGNGFCFKETPDKVIIKGDTCNTSIWNLTSHTGTHIDAPFHFNAKGKSIDTYSADYFVSKLINIIDISPVNKGQLIRKKDLNFKNVQRETEILIVKTGFGKYRGSEKYWKSNPGIHPEVADALIEQFPYLKAIGLDLISISSFLHREIGREAHKNFLCGNKAILLIEDMNLSSVHQNTKIKTLIVSPLRVENADGAPCTIFAEVAI